MRPGPTLTEDKLDRYRPLGAFGQPVYRSHVQLQAALRQHVGEKYANYFAVPRVDAQGRTVSWVSPVEGEAVRWSDLSREEQASRSLDLQLMKSEFDGYIGRLKDGAKGDKDSGGAEAFIAILEQALKTPSDRHLFFVGEQPVATFWGFRDENSPPFETLTAAPRIAAAPAAVTEAVTTEAVTTAAVAAKVVVSERRGFPWWLLLLLAFILLALFLWWLWPREQPDHEVPVAAPDLEVRPIRDFSITIPSSCPREVEVCVRDHACEDGDEVRVSINDSVVFSGEISNEPQCRIVPVREGGNPVEMFALNGYGGKGEGTCSPEDINTGEIRITGSGGSVQTQQWAYRGGTGSRANLVVTTGSSVGNCSFARSVPAERTSVIPGMTDAISPNPDRAWVVADGGTAPEGGADVEDGQGDGAPPGSEASAGSAGDAETPEALEQTPQEPESSPPDPSVPGPGEPPVIPDNVQDGAARFMQGVWQSDSGLVSSTGQKLTQEYTFDDQGEGETVIRQADGVVCRGPAKATMEGGNLHVDEENLPCSNGSSFRRSRTVCSMTPSGKAECVGTHDDGRRFNVELKRGSRS